MCENGKEQPGLARRIPASQRAYVKNCRACPANTTMHDARRPRTAACLLLFFCVFPCAFLSFLSFLSFHLLCLSQSSGFWPQPDTTDDTKWARTTGGQKVGKPVQVRVSPESLSSCFVADLQRGCPLRIAPKNTDYGVRNKLTGRAVSKRGCGRAKNKVRFGAGVNSVALPCSRGCFLSRSLILPFYFIYF